MLGGWLRGTIVLNLSGVLLVRGIACDPVGATTLLPLSPNQVASRLSTQEPGLNHIAAALWTTTSASARVGNAKLELPHFVTPGATSAPN